ncbi:Spy/CpxP family protein refolding chaperone [Yoonia sediminilitoris]|uniref:Spy/CpxP family protein refolding chaperone n=1 Tax=Yoonia sediminilitoris TaxID=1286148 RepID=A0A2T6K7L9_9RHOB|nr:hypothetical protein [Yoonia sediminilitoris]PUB10696.1 Spy/CpxP family protein refolding chaperone [Yoonia sediminilitoris]RCW90448.1 Spy/CpxP family protein refolding chaperone [Yoonia sediminilitoris]
MTRLFAFLIASVAFSSIAAADETHQPYQGFETREITSLSEQDIEALREGSGWGLALPAELNGYPGPAHVLELADELDLSDGQQQRISMIFKEMRVDAIAKGEALIEAERSLDEGFRSTSLDANQLRHLIDEAEAARADLRYVHLSRHLMTTELLSAEKVAAYAVLRGYASDPCSSVPDGHDATLWQRHNGCDDQ